MKTTDTCMECGIVYSLHDTADHPFHIGPANILPLQVSIESRACPTCGYRMRADDPTSSVKVCVNPDCSASSPVSGNVRHLQLLWARAVLCGMSDSSIHELVTLAQDMELNRIVVILENLIANHKISGEVRTMLVVMAAEFSAKKHRPV